MVHFRCAVDGCTETAHYSYGTRADYARLLRENAERPWKCSRHRHPEQVLTPTNTTRTVVLTAERSKKHPDLTKLFWRQDDAEHVGTIQLALDTAEDTTDSLGNIYRLDWIDRMQGERASNPYRIENGATR